MIIIIDANVFFSVLIKGGKTLDIFLLNRSLRKFEFFAPEYLIIEAKKHMSELIEKTKLLSEDLERIFNFMEKELRLIPFEEFIEMYELAEKISPDPKDIMYLALATKLNGALWSNDKRLKKQCAIKIYSTEEILKILG
jgi:predicted nucleic acid-binding protein